MLTEDWLSIAFVLLCLVASFFFSASETALTAMSRARMLRLEKNGNPRATMVNRLIETRERMIGAILTGNNIANIAASTVATSVLLFWFGDVGVLYATVIMTVLTVVFTEVLPKTLAINAPDRVALLVARPISWAVRLFGPMLIGVEAMVRWILRLVGVRVGIDQAYLSAHEELRGQVDLLHHEGSVEKQDRDMLSGLLDLRDLDGRRRDDPPHRDDHGVRRPHPRGNRQGGARRVGHAHSAVEGAPGEHHRRAARQGSAARDPGGRWRSDQDRRRDDRAAAVVRARHPAAVRAAQGVPPPQDAVRAGGRRVRRGDGPGDARGHLEEIVGDISDEYDIVVPGVRPQPDGSVTVDGGVPIRDLNRAMEWSLPDEEATTIAGLVIHEARSIPEPGQSFTFHGFRFRVLRRERNRITALRITPLVKKPVAKTA